MRPSRLDRRRRRAKACSPMPGCRAWSSSPRPDFDNDAGRRVGAARGGGGDDGHQPRQDYLSASSPVGVRRLGISIQPARVGMGPDKAAVERWFRTAREGFLAALPGYKGPRRVHPILRCELDGGGVIRPSRPRSSQVTSNLPRERRRLPDRRHRRRPRPPMRQ
jgi:hypothetical protein